MGLVFNANGINNDVIPKLKTSKTNLNSSKTKLSSIDIPTNFNYYSKLNNMSEDIEAIRTQIQNLIDWLNTKIDSFSSLEKKNFSNNLVFNNTSSFSNSIFTTNKKLVTTTVKPINYTEKNTGAKVSSSSKSVFTSIEFWASKKWEDLKSNTGATIWKDVKSALASIANLFLAFAKGVVKFIETLIDLLDIIGTGILTIGTAIGDIIVGNDWATTKEMWKETMAFVAKDHVGSEAEKFYKTTPAGQWLDNNAYSPFKSDGIACEISEGLGYVVGLIALTVVTAGTGTAVAGASTAVSASTVITSSAIVGLTTFSSVTAATWADMKDKSWAGVEESYKNGEVDQETYNSFKQIHDMSDEEWSKIEESYKNGEISEEDYNSIKSIREMPDEWQTTENIKEGLKKGGWEGTKAAAITMATMGIGSKLSGLVTSKLPALVSKLPNGTQLVTSKLISNVVEETSEAGVQFGSELVSTKSVSKAFENVGGKWGIALDLGLGILLDLDLPGKKAVGDINLKPEYVRTTVDPNGKIVFDDVVDSSAALSKNLAQIKYNNAKTTEPNVTNSLKNLEDSSSKLVGLDHKLKTVESLERKIRSDAIADNISLEEASEKISDSLRYTLEISDINYTKKVSDTLKELESQGYKIDKFKNTWGEELYQGININLTTPDGVKMELQFHTADSFYAKELNHEWYDIARSDTATLEEIDNANAIMKANQTKVNIPKEIKGLKLDDILGLNFDTMKSIDFVESSVRSEFPKSKNIKTVLNTYLNAPKTYLIDFFDKHNIGKTYYGADQNATRKYHEFTVKKSIISDYPDYANYLKNKFKLTDKQIEDFLPTIDVGKKCTVNTYDNLETFFVNKFPDEDAMTIVNRIYDFIEPNEAAEFIRLKNKLIEMYGMTSRDATKILDMINTKGVCSYSATANEIIASFFDNPGLFEQKFGFSIFTTIDGKQTLNTSELITDMYLKINSNCQANSGSLFDYVDGKITLTGLETSNQQYLSKGYGKNKAVIRDYLQEYGLIYDCKYTYNMESGIDIKESVTDWMSQGKVIYMGVKQMENWDMYFRNIDGSINTSVSNWEEGVSHAVFVTGLEGDKLIISSWGEKLYIDLKEMSMLPKDPFGEGPIIMAPVKVIVGTE